ncbi:MAG: peptide deformylase [Clostridia bacterium]
MAIRRVVKQGDPILRKRSREIIEINQRIIEIIEDMTETLYKENGIGIAAPQIGILKRIVVIDQGDGPIELINPVMLSCEGEQEGTEGCLSVPGEFGLVKRPACVRIKALNRKGKRIELIGDGMLARAFCHEIDHLDGKLFVDIATEMYSQEEIDQMEGK